MKLYKLTGKGGCTKNNTHWDIGVTHEVTGVPELCTRTVLHAYTSPLLAAFMWPAHLHGNPEQFFVCEGEVVISDGTKVGCQKLTVIDTFELPELTDCQRVAFGILSALQVYKDNTYQSWAGNWLTGKDRSVTTAYAIAKAQLTDNIFAAYAANYAAAAAKYAATAAVYSVNTAAGYSANTAAKYAADAAQYADDADYMTYSRQVINFEQLALEALKY